MAPPPSSVKVTKLDRDLSEAASGFSLAKAMADRSAAVRTTARAKVDSIRKITSQSRFLALNAMIEATRAGELGAGFQVVAREMREVSDKIEAIAENLDKEIGAEVESLVSVCNDVSNEMKNERLVDLALNAIELIDRNLYERTCDVRWWATDAAIVECAANPTRETVAYASKRLGIILESYTVYLDLWIIGMDGTILATGRPERYSIIGKSVADADWFIKSLKLRSGQDYSVSDVDTMPLLSNAQVATYCASIREGAASSGRPLGTLAIHFDWEPQARAIVEGVRLSAEERKRNRVLLVDGRSRVIASTAGPSAFRSLFKIDTSGSLESGHYVRDGKVTAYHVTPGYETYRGLGWYGVIAEA